MTTRYGQYGFERRREGEKVLSRTLRVSTDIPSLLQIEWPTFEVDVDFEVLLILPEVFQQLRSLEEYSRKLTRKRPAIVRERLYQQISKDIGVPASRLESLWHSFKEGDDLVVKLLAVRLGLAGKLSQLKSA
jgi:hypothetical protein